MTKITSKISNAAVAAVVAVVAVAGVGAYASASAQTAGVPKANVTKVGCEVVGGAEEGGYANIRFNNSAAGTANDFIVTINGVQVMRHTLSAYATEDVQVFFTNKNTAAQINVKAEGGLFLEGLNVSRGMCNG